MIATPLVCSSCDAGINPDEIVAGLAVRIDGQLLCATCVETLPSETQVGINRIRALRGLNVVTYRVSIARLPNSALYTFTTSSQLNVHRRELAATGEFVAPVLPPPSQRPDLPGAQEAAPSAPAVRATTPPASGRRSSLIGLWVGAGVLVVGGATIALATSGRGERIVNPPLAPKAIPSAPVAAAAPAAASRPTGPTTPPPAANNAPPTPTVHQPPGPRPDAQDDPLAAWRAANLDRSCPAPVLAALAESVVAMRTAQLDAAEIALDAGRIDEARLRLRAMRLPNEAVFAALNLRDTALNDRLAQPVATPANPPVVEEETPVAIVDPTPPPEVAAPTPANPGAECWLVQASHLGGDTARMGKVQRTLPTIAGGTYQVWIRAQHANRSASLSCTIGGVESRQLSAAGLSAATWTQLSTASGTTFTLPPGTLPLTLDLRQDRWQVHEIYLAGTGHRPPSDGTALAAATSPWTPPPPTSAPDDPAHRLFGEGTISEWLPAFAFPKRAVEDAKDGSVLIPSPWPLGTAFFYRATKLPTGTRRYALALEIPAEKVTGGGLAVLIHRGSANRTALTVSLQVDANTIPLSPLRLDRGWQQVAIELPPMATGISTVVLRLEDADDKSPDRGFVLGKVTLVAGRAPSPDDLALEPSPLLGDDPLFEAEARTRLRTLLAKVLERRPAKSRSVSIRNLGLAIAKLDDETMATLRKAFVPLLGRELARPDFVNLPLTPAAWEEIQHGSVHSFNADTISLVAFCPNASEVAALAQPGAFSAWLQRQLNSVISGDGKGKRGGILPVAVIGGLTPSPDAANTDRLGVLWENALGECARLGIPVIDVRAAQTATALELRTKAARLLVEGLRTLGLQLEATQRGAR